MRTVINGLVAVVAMAAPQVALYYLYQQIGYENPIFWAAVTADALFLFVTTSKGSNG